MQRTERIDKLLVAGLLAVVLAGCREAAIAAANADQLKIENAMTAAPDAVARGARIVDWPTENGEMRELRPGTNGWTCFPDRPDTDGNDPMCMDEPWMEWMHALMVRAQPRIDRVGVSYMIAEGGVSTSNIDPFATGPTHDNEWGFDGPHLMIIVPDVAVLEGLPTKRDGGGPYVMFAGTPYAHIMIPVQ